MIISELTRNKLSLAFCLFVIISGDNVLISTVATLYFIFDSYLLMNEKNPQYFFLLHHVISVIVFPLIHYSSSPYIIDLFIFNSMIMELSNLTLYINHYLVITNKKNWKSFWYCLFFTVHLTNYMFCRLLVVGIQLIRNRELIMNNVLLQVASLIYIGGIYWSYLLIQKFRSKQVRNILCQRLRKKSS